MVVASIGSPGDLAGELDVPVDRVDRRRVEDHDGEAQAPELGDRLRRGERVAAREDDVGRHGDDLLDVDRIEGGEIGHVAGLRRVEKDVLALALDPVADARARTGSRWWPAPATRSCAARPSRVIAVPSSSVSVVGKAGAGVALGVGVAAIEAAGLAAVVRRRDRRGGGSAAGAGGDEEQERGREGSPFASAGEAASGTRGNRSTWDLREGCRRGRRIANPSMSNGSNEGSQPVGRTVLPTFLSKVRACTVRSATGLPLPEGRSP